MSGYLECSWCGRAFERRSDRGPTPKYCSDSHRQQAYHARRSISWALSPSFQAQLRAAAATFDVGAATVDAFKIDAATLDAFKLDAATLDALNSFKLDAATLDALDGLDRITIDAATADAVAALNGSLTAAMPSTEVLSALDAYTADATATDLYDEVVKSVTTDADLIGALDGLAHFRVDVGLAATIAALNDSLTLALPSLDTLSAHAFEPATGLTDAIAEAVKHATPDIDLTPALDVLAAYKADVGLTATIAALNDSPTLALPSLDTLSAHAFEPATGLTDAIAEAVKHATPDIDLTPALDVLAAYKADVGLTATIAALNDSLTLALPSLDTLSALSVGLCGIELGPEWSELLVHVRDETTRLKTVDDVTRAARTPILVAALAAILIAAVVRGALQQLGTRSGRAIGHYGATDVQSRSVDRRQQDRHGCVAALSSVEVDGWRRADRSDVERRRTRDPPYLALFGDDGPPTTLPPPPLRPVARRA